MYNLDQKDQDGKIVATIVYQTKEAAEIGFKTLNFLLESVDSKYTYEITEKRCEVI